MYNACDKNLNTHISNNAIKDRKVEIKIKI